MTPKVSVLVPDGADEQRLGRTVASLARQGDVDWQVVAVAAARGGKVAPTDRRVVRIPVAAGGDDPGTRLEAARRHADGELVGVLQAGDELEPGALRSALTVLDAAPDAAAVYTDEQWPDSGVDGIATKPDFLPHYLESYPYIGRLWLVRREVLEQVGGFRPGLGSATEWDAQLRVAEHGARTVHAPVVAVTRLSAPGTAAADSADCLKVAAARRERSGRRGRVELADVPLGVRTWWEPDEAPLVSIVIPTAGQSRLVRGRDTVLVEQCVASILERTTYSRWEIVLVTSAHTPGAVVDRLRGTLGDRLVVAPIDGPFNFSASVNEGARAARGDLLLLLNDDTEVLEPRWLDRMVSVASDPRVGAVGAKLLFEDGRIQHVGITVNDARVPMHPLIFEPDGPGRFGTKALDVDWEAVTGACLLTPADVFAEVGGFTTELPLNFNDVDFCLKVRARGRDVVTTPFARLVHFESSSRVAVLDESEQRFVDRHWGLRLAADPHVEYRSDL